MSPESQSTQLIVQMLTDLKTEMGRVRNGMDDLRNEVNAERITAAASAERLQNLLGDQDDIRDRLEKVEDRMNHIPPGMYTDQTRTSQVGLVGLGAVIVGGTVKVLGMVGYETWKQLVVALSKAKGS